MIEQGSADMTHAVSGNGHTELTFNILYVRIQPVKTLLVQYVNVELDNKLKCSNRDNINNAHIIVWYFAYSV